MLSYIECLISLVLVILFALVFLHVSGKPRSKLVPPKVPPSPPRLPTIGNLHQLGKLPHQNLYKLSQKYGQVMLLQLGRIPTIVISSPEMAKQILKTHDVDLCSRPESPGPRKLTYNLLDVAFSPFNDQWKERRKILSFELLNSKRSHTLWKFKREEVTTKLIESLSSEASQKNTINVDEKMFQVMGEIITSVAFGKCCNDYQFKNGNHELKDFLGEISEMLLTFCVEDYFPSILGRIIDAILGHRSKLNNCFAKTDEYFSAILQDHIDKQEASRGELQEDLVDVMIRSSMDLSCHLSADHIKGMFLNIFLGGVDTSSNTIVWAMTELVRNQRVMKKVQDEIRSSIGIKEKLNGQDIEELKYLKMVVKETLRLHPAAPLLVPREAMHACEIDDNGNYYVIQPKTRILVNAWAIARDPKSWKNPNEFYPERFEESDIDFKGTFFELLPFGSGRRICPGLKISIMSMEFILTNLLYFFNWELPDGIKVEGVSLEEIGGITIHKKIPLSLKPVKYM
ncbi:oxygenase [Lithospermum erythrorhizon]|uniref:Oxygenase n=1 Tax=Lithospermum erythrorhizon TaxID=34254 RepID=A0AAV3NSY0_LITER